MMAVSNSHAFEAEVIDNHLSDHHNALVRAANERKGTSAVHPRSDLFDEDEVMPGGCVPRVSPTESITSFAMASAKRRKNIGALSEGWPVFQRGGIVPLPSGTKPRMSPPTFEPSMQKKADQECTLLAGQQVAATDQNFNILEDQFTKFFVLQTHKSEFQAAQPNTIEWRLAGHQL